MVRGGAAEDEEEGEGVDGDEDVGGVVAGTPSVLVYSPTFRGKNLQGGRQVGPGPAEV